MQTDCCKYKAPILFTFLHIVTLAVEESLGTLYTKRSHFIAKASRFSFILIVTAVTIKVNIVQFLFVSYTLSVDEKLEVCLWHLME